MKCIGNKRWSEGAGVLFRGLGGFWRGGRGLTIQELFDGPVNDLTLRTASFLRIQQQPLQKLGVDPCGQVSLCSLLRHDKHDASITTKIKNSHSCVTEIIVVYLCHMYTTVAEPRYISHCPDTANAALAHLVEALTMIAEHYDELMAEDADALVTLWRRCWMNGVAFSDVFNAEMATIAAELRQLEGRENHEGP